MTGSELKDRLIETRYTMAEIARKMGIKPQDLNAFFKVQDTKTGTIERLAEALDLPVAYFFGDSYNVSGNNNATAINNSVATATANDDRLLTLLLNKDEQLLKSMEQTTLAMQQTSKAQEQMGEIIAELRKR